MAERRPIEIIGAEHYLTVGHRWSCSAAPIFDSKNQLIAVLNVSQLREKYHSHTLGMVRAAAYAISEQLRLRALLQQQQAIIELLDEGVIVVSRSGEVKLMNSKAASMLGLPAPQQGENIYKFMPLRRCSTTSSRRSPYHGSGSAVPLGIRFAVLFLFGHVPDQRGLRGAHVPGGPAYAGIRGPRRRVEGRVHV